jgi:hypothetical protein
VVALREISRQAQIFGNAKAVIAWLNDVEHWDGSKQTIEWLSLGCLENVGGNEEVFPHTGVDQPTWLVAPDDETDQTLCGWLTSLWTLQEACLRPDMLLCNRQFELLTLPNTAVTFDNLVALLAFAVGSYSSLESPFESVVNRAQRPESMKRGTVLEYEGIIPLDSKRTRRVLETLPPNAIGVIQCPRRVRNA